MVDFGLDDDEFATEPAARNAEREMVPEGEHPFQIRQVTQLEDGRVEVRLEHADKRFGWVFGKFPKTGWGARLLSELRRACHMSREEWAAADITDLAGRRVRARVYHKGQYVNVGEFIPGDPPGLPPVERAVAPPSSRATPKRTATQRADAAAAMPEDDIPF